MKTIKFSIICGLCVFMSSTIPNLVLANNWSGDWKGFLTSSTPIECGFEEMQAAMGINRNKFTIETSDAAGPVKFEGNVIENAIDQSIMFNMVTEVGGTEKNNGRLKGRFSSDQGRRVFKGGFYVQQMSDGGYSAHIMVCEVKLNLKPQNINYQNSNEKKLIDNNLEDKVNEIKKLLSSGLITKAQYNKIVDRIYEKEQTNKRRNQNKKFEEAIAKIKNLLKDGLINKKEYSSLREKLIKQHLGITK